MPSAISIQTQISVQWRSEAAPLASQGVLLLRVLAQLESAQPHLEDDVSLDSQRWQSLEARVDLCLNMLGQLLLRDIPLPPPTSLRLSASSAEWLQGQALEVGSQGSLAMYLSPAVPQALILPAKIRHCQAEGDAWRVVAQFELQDAELLDWLDKTLFRRHRREIFERKHSIHED